MNKYLFLISLFLIGCGGGNSEMKPILSLDDVDYIVSGQSNTLVCDWNYFTQKTGLKVHNIAMGGRNINYIIEHYTHILKNKSVKGIIFVHGESDAIEYTDPYTYAARVEAYRQIVSADIGHNLPMFISTVGYASAFSDDHFDVIRQSVIDYKFKDWTIAYEGAQYFRDWGFLQDDGIHFNQQGCEAMMDAVAITLENQN